MNEKERANKRSKSKNEIQTDIDEQFGGRIQYSIKLSIKCIRHEVSYYR